MSASYLDHTELRHHVVEGPATSWFLRDGALMVHALLNTAPSTRLLFAFAAGNSGAGLWFDDAPADLAWLPEGELESVDEHAGMQGASLVLRATTDRLLLRQGLMGSIRMLRDYQYDRRLFDACTVAPELSASQALWARPRLDGAAGYRIRLEMLDGGHIEALPDGRLQLTSNQAGQGLHLRLQVETGDTALRPLGADALLTDDAAQDPAMRRSLALLCFADEWLAGSWRFLTYFGRDTLMSLRLLLPVLKRPAVHGALASVLRRLSLEGRVAHEEDIGEFPAQLRLQRGEAADCTPIYDYKMVDDDFMLLPVLADCLLGQPDGAEFLAAPLGAQSAAALLLRNARYVMARTAAFGRDPRAGNLVPLGEGEIVGDWRDSADGLAGGHYAYSVNAALAPAALQALARLMESGLLLPHLQPGDAELLAPAAAWAKVWAREAPRCFAVRQDSSSFRRALAAHAVNLPVSALRAAEQSLIGADTLRFAALSLDAMGQPIPVMHSDFGFVLLFGDPDAATLETELAALARPYPAGLMTDAGMLVANAAPAPAQFWPMFGRDRYHGAVVWSWQQALMAAGLARQRTRTDLPASTLLLLKTFEAQLWRAIQATREAAQGELWSWSHDGEQFQLAPYGPMSATADESNAIQLWSTVYLAVQPPA